MHFTCESCKASLNIADDKVRGKRLVVRCKRCGSRIQISDPALGMAAVLLGPQAGQASPAKPAQGAPPAAARPSAPGRGPGTASGLPGRAAPRSVPAPGARASAPGLDREADLSGEDTESTRAMDSEVLEQALRASKVAEGGAGSSASARRPSASAASAPARAASPSLQRPAAAGAATWFAMIAGKQVGPVSLGELGGQVLSGALGPRSYVWTEGMAGWVRAQEVPALAAHFRAPPEAPRSAPNPQRAPPSRPAPASASVPASATSLARSAPRPGPSRGALRPAGDGKDSPFDFGGLDLGADAEEAQAAPTGRAAEEREPDQGLELDAYDPAAELDDFDPAAPAAPSDRSAARSDPAAARVDRDAPEGSAAGAPAVDDRAAAASAQPAADDQGAPASADAAPLELDDGAGAHAAGDPAPSREGDTPEPGGEPEAAVPFEPEAAVPFEPDPGQAAPDGSRRSLSARVRPLLLAAAGVLLALALGLLAHELAGRSRPQKAPAQAVPQEARTDAAKGAKPKGQAPSAGAVEPPAGRDGQGARAARGQGETGLTAEDVKRKLEQNKGALQRCIDEALRRAPRDPAVRAGRIRITTTIAPTGAVIGTRIDKRAVDESALGACLKTATRRIAFPAFAGEPIDVDIPIDVTAGE